MQSVVLSTRAWSRSCSIADVIAWAQGRTKRDRAGVIVAEAPVAGFQIDSPQHQRRRKVESEVLSILPQGSFVNK